MDVVQSNTICSGQVYLKNDTNTNQILTQALNQYHIKLHETEKISFQFGPRSIKRLRVPNKVEANSLDNVY